MTGARAIVAAAFAAVALAAGCKRTDDESRIRQLVLDAAAAAQDHDTSGVLAPFAADFCGYGLEGDRRGAVAAKAGSCTGANLQTVRRAVIAQLLPRSWIRVFVPRLEVRLTDADRAQAHLSAVIARGNPVERLEDLVPSNGDAFEFDFGLERRDEGWIIVRGEMRRGTGWR